LYGTNILFFVHAMKVQAEEKFYLYLFLTSALNTDWCLPSRTGLLTMAENPPLIMKLHCL